MKRFFTKQSANEQQHQSMRPDSQWAFQEKFEASSWFQRAIDKEAINSLDFLVQTSVVSSRVKIFRSSIHQLLTRRFWKIEQLSLITTDLSSNCYSEDASRITVRPESAKQWTLVLSERLSTVHTATCVCLHVDRRLSLHVGRLQVQVIGPMGCLLDFGQESGLGCKLSC